MTRHGFDCCVSNNRVPCERSEQSTSTLNVRDNICQLLTQLYRVCRVSEANRTLPQTSVPEHAPTAVPKSRQLPWYTVYIHCTYTYEFCRYRQN